MNITGIIPARFASSRFPGKPLASIGNKSMIQRVFERASAAKSLNEVIIATDDERIKKHCLTFTESVVLTDPSHPSGTDRCYEAYKKNDKPARAVINIQGDEPFIDPDQIDLVAAGFKDDETEIVTLKKALTGEEEILDENIVKVITDCRGHALYFSRTAIPHIRNKAEKNLAEQHDFFKHIGIYGYRTDILKRIVDLRPSPLEIAEKLEQLRWLENGYTIKVTETKTESLSVDMPKDIEKLKSLYHL